LFHTGERFIVGDGGSTVVDSISDFGPSVIYPRANDIDFISPSGSVFGFPNSSCFGMDGYALGVAMTIGINGGFGSFGIDKGIVGGNATV
jgi:hypothetical protein